METSATERIVKDNIFATRFNHTLHAYIDIAGDLVSGTLLGQIVYWFGNNRDGASRTRIERDGFVWIVRKRADWIKEIRISPKQYDRAVRELSQKGIIVTKVYKYNGDTITHLRVNFEALNREIESWKENQYNSGLAEKVKNENSTDGELPKTEFGNSQNGNSGITQRGIPESPKGEFHTTNMLYNNTISDTDTYNKDLIKEHDISIYRQVSENREFPKIKTKEKKEKQPTGNFELWWSSYPASRRVAKPQCVVKFSKLSEDEQKKCIEHTASMKQTEQWQNEKYVPMTTTYLNQQRWESAVPEDNGSRPAIEKDTIKSKTKFQFKKL